MAKANMIEREKKRQKLVLKYKKRRTEIKSLLKKANSLTERFQLSNKLQDLPRNSSPNRMHNRCAITGRSKGYFRDFGLSRHVLREMAHIGLLPGVTKASW